MIPTLKHVRFLFRVIVSLVFFAGVIFAALVIYVRISFAGTAEFPVECALVFGAAVHSREDPGPAINRRVHTTTRLQQEGNIGRLYFSGGKGSETQESEAAVMRKVALLDGMDPDIIVIEESARSTWQNLQFSKPLLKDCSSIVGISDRYHLARIKLLANMQDYENFSVYPADRIATFPFEARSIVREVFGILYYKVLPLVGYPITL